MSPSTGDPIDNATDGSTSGPVAVALRWLTRLEHGLVLTVVAAVAILPALESLSRRLFGAGVPGSLLYTQHLTLWIAFLGALLATAGPGKHLALATGNMLRAPKARQIARIYVAAQSAAVCGLLAYASVILVQADSARPSTLPGGIPEWVSELVMPAAMALIALRFVWNAGSSWRPRLIALAVASSCGLFAFADTVAEAVVIPGIIAILAGLVLGAPIFVAMAGLAMLLFFSEATPIASVPAETYRLVSSSALPAIPLLTLGGYILAAGGAPTRLLRLIRASGGWMPGGTAVMVCFVCAGFTAFTGGSGVTILAVGGLVLPMLIAENYPKGFSLGLVTCSGSLGLLFPPSLPVILYAVVAHASVEDLFIAGFVPGLVLVLVVAAFGVVTGVRSKVTRQPFSLAELGGALWQAKWEVAIPLIVVLSVITGYATIVEAAALAVLCALLSQTLAFKDLHPIRDVPRVALEATTLVGAVLIVLGVAMGLTSYLVDAEIPSALLEWSQTHIQSPIVFLLILNIVLLVLGSILEIYSAIVILAPLLVPLAPAYGIDPLHLGIIFLANLELGFLFPPMGLNLILSSTRFEKPLTSLYKVILPFLLISAIGLGLITYVPSLTHGLLHWLRPQTVQTQIGQPASADD